MRYEDTDLVIVGGGVAGLLMAVEAFRRGLTARVLERSKDSLPAPASAVFLPAALPALARLGVYEPLRARGARLDGIRLHLAGSGETALEVPFQGLDAPFRHAIAVSQASLEQAFTDTFRKYRAIRLEHGTELLSLDRDNGRVAGAVARDPEGDVTFRSRLVIVTTGSGGAPIRAEVGAATRSLPYPERQLCLTLERPESWRAEIEMWVGAGRIVSSYPMSPSRLRVEVLGPSRELEAEVGGGPTALRRALSHHAPALEEALKSLGSTQELRLVPVTRSRVASWTQSGVALLGPAAYAMSPAGLAADTQAALDAEALAAVVSGCQFRGDFSAHALAPYGARRRPLAGAVGDFVHALHKLGTGRRCAPVLGRLAGSSALVEKARALGAGFGARPLFLGDRLRLLGLPLPGG